MRQGALLAIVAEPTPWLGGMLSAAGVSATDGHHRLPSGPEIFAARVEALFDPFSLEAVDHRGRFAD